MKIENFSLQNIKKLENIGLAVAGLRMSCTGDTASFMLSSSMDTVNVVGEIPFSEYKEMLLRLKDESESETDFVAKYAQELKKFIKE